MDVELRFAADTAYGGSSRGDRSEGYYVNNAFVDTSRIYTDDSSIYGLVVELLQQ